MVNKLNFDHRRNQKSRKNNKSISSLSKLNIHDAMHTSHFTSKSKNHLAITQSFNDRMKMFEKTKNEKAKKRKEERANRELEECTFRPKVITNRSLDHKTLRTSKSVQNLYKARSINEFLRDQDNFAMKKTKHLEEISKERDRIEDKTFKPIIDKKSRRIGSQEKIRQNTTVHERLHKLSKNTKKNSIQKSIKTSMHNAKSQSIIDTQRNYLTEKLNIAETLMDKSNLSHSRSRSKRKNLHEELYDDALKRKLNQASLESQLLRNQSVRSFIKHRNSSNSDFTGIF